MASPRKLYIVGNWKMNPDSPIEAKAVFSASERAAKKARKVSVIVCPPSIYLPLFARGAKKRASLGVQDVHTEHRGSYTGGISADQAKNSGAAYAIVGHSERRKAGDNDEMIRAKTLAALEVGLKVILCVGEEVRDDHGEYLSFVRNQVLSAIATLPKKYISDVIVAYEPVWAIGKSYDSAPTPSEIHEMSLFIKKVVSEVTSRDNALRTLVLYGGSVDFDNAQGILSDGEIDGLLLGRQSLDTENFPRIILYANSI
ncbi:MAG: triose-phosphate isomerase [Candidatus Paceibacterota bacterium]|jgi:triosephosphate isomerase